MDTPIAKTSPMPIRSMTGFAQVRGEIQRPQSSKSGADSSNGRLAFALSLKSVNHRFLDLHFRLPSGTDSLEMNLRRLLKEKISRGHVEVTLSLDRAANETFSLNREIVGGYIAAFRAAAAEFSLTSDPDLNAVQRIRRRRDRGLRDRLRQRGSAPPQPDARRRGPWHRPRAARAHGPSARSRQERAKTSPRGFAELQRALAIAPAGTSRRNRRQGARAAGGRPPRRPQRYSGRGCPPRNAYPAFSRAARGGWRDRQEARLPSAGNESRSQHAAFENIGSRR